MTDQNDTPEFDMDAAVEDVAAGLGLSRPDSADTESAPDEVAAGDDTPEQQGAPQSGAEADQQAQAATTTPTAMNAPQSWAKEHHQTWASLPPQAQQYIALREKQMLDGLEQYKGHASIGRQMSEAIHPFLPTLQQRGIEPAKAVQALLNAQAMLDRDPVAGLRKLASDYRVDLSKIAAENTLPIDPNVAALQERLQQFESKLTERDQAELAIKREAVANEVETFANDPANAHFDEVADDIAALMKAYPNLSLKDAYDKAVWANPVTRAKETSRLQQDTEKKLRENARLNALKAKTAASATVRSRDTRRTPTEPIGTMNDTMDEVLKSIRTRTH
jgi:hypothetical protein